MNPTIEKFGYPTTLIKAYEHWVVLARPAQVTLGSLILAARSPATAYSHLPVSAFAEQAQVVAEIERALAAFSGYEKINYLMLMMVDPHVHYHIIPRYEGERSWDGLTLKDAGWPGVPDLKNAVALDGEQMAALVDELQQLFR
ncbi:HIT family protein [Sphingomonas piscis]|uniref:HIT family protein n=1 Tax=Sphingomonas piscis TaxID=2714943 RepID=A0A6G7YTQ5_9SPHN|nr:HIT family protein [Sphingomonas piscis]QIK80122.1 HIT family protein [Sphingomonas piscis]